MKLICKEQRKTSFVHFYLPIQCRGEIERLYLISIYWEGGKINAGYYSCSRYGKAAQRTDTE